MLQAKKWGDTIVYMWKKLAGEPGGQNTRCNGRRTRFYTELNTVKPVTEHSPPDMDNITY